MDWVNKRVMVTGGSGFIGSVLRSKLEELGAYVRNYDRMDALHSNVLDEIILRQYFEIFVPQLVYHLAAQVEVPVANQHPRATLETNIMGTLNIIDLCAEFHVPCIIASSDKAYGEADTPYTINSPLNAKHPYDLSKAVGEKIAQVYLDRGADIKIVRLCNVYGPGDTHLSRLIPHVVSSYVAGEKPVLRGNLDMVREWLYIDDAVQFYIDVAGKPETIYQHGGIRKTVGEVVEIIRKKLGGKTPVMRYAADGEIQYQTFDDMTVNTPFEEGIDKTIAWWKDRTS